MAKNKRSRKRQEKKKAPWPKQAPELICSFYADLESAFLGTVERRLLPGTLALYEGDPDPRRRFTFRPRTAEFSALPERQGERWIVRCSILFRAGSKPIERQEWLDSFDAGTGRLCPPPRPPRRLRSARKEDGTDRVTPGAGTGPLARLRRLFSPRSGPQPKPAEQTPIPRQKPDRRGEGGKTGL